MSKTSVENKVIVKIFGDEYPITGSQDPAYISKVADLVDSRMQQLATQSRTQAKDKIAILTALSLASELMDSNETLGEVQSDHGPMLDRLISKIDEALKLESPAIT